MPLPVVCKIYGLQLRVTVKFGCQSWSIHRTTVGCQKCFYLSKVVLGAIPFARVRSNSSYSGHFTIQAAVKQYKVPISVLLAIVLVEQWFRGERTCPLIILILYTRAVEPGVRLGSCCRIHATPLNALSTTVCFTSCLP